MEPVTTAALIGGGLQLAGSAFNAFQQSKNRDVQINLANTAHQREVKDLKAAGLNPILSGNGGQGAAAPNVQAPQIDTGGTVSTALQAAQVKMAMAQQAAQLDLMKNQSLSAMADWQNKSLDFQLKDNGFSNALEAQRLQVQGSKLDNQTKERMLEKIEKDIKLLELNSSHSALDLWRAKSEAKFYESIGGDINPWMKIMNGTLNAAKAVNEVRR